MTLPVRLTRRDVIARAAAALLAPWASRAARLRGANKDDASDRLAAVEARVGGRLGVAALDTATGRRLAYRDADRFPMCSTFKWLLVTHVLSRVEARQDQLDRFVRYGPEDLLEYAPVTRAHVSEGGMTVSALCAAAVEQSDNTAGNLLLTGVGGPAGLTAYLRSIGDAVTRLDRNEPALNVVEPGDPRDTTTPAAMLRDMERVLLGSTVLSETFRQQLLDWLIGGTTGATKLRAGLPAGWRVGDKTGTGAHGATNDLAIAWPPGRPPILIAAYSVGSSASPDVRDAALADTAREIASAFR